MGFLTLQFGNGLNATVELTHDIMSLGYLKNTNILKNESKNKENQKLFVLCQNKTRKIDSESKTKCPSHVILRVPRDSVSSR